MSSHGKEEPEGIIVDIDTQTDQDRSMERASSSSQERISDEIRPIAVMMETAATTSMTSRTNLISVDTPVAPISTAEDLTEVELMDIVDVTKAPVPAPNDKQAPPEKMKLVHWVLMAQMLLLTLSVMYVEMCLVPALPLISKQYPSQKSWVAWVLAAYNVVGGIWTPIAGSLSDQFGVKTLAMGSLVLYLAGQIGCALSTNIWILIVFRGVQGFGMALFVLCFTAIRKLFPPKVVPIALGSISSMFSFGMSIGMVGGAATITRLTDSGSRWEYVFFISMPIIILLIITFAFTLPNVKEGKKRRIDFLGCILLTVGLILLLSGLTLSESLAEGWGSPIVITFLIVGPLTLVGFVLWEIYCKDPLINMRFFLRRNMCLANLVAFCVGFGLFSIFQILPYVFSVRLGYTDQFNISLLLLPFGLPQLFAGPFAAFLGRKIGYSITLMTGIAMVMFSFGLYIEYHNTTVECVLLNLLGGSFMGFVMVSMMNVVSEASTPQEFGSASGTNTLLRIIGGAVGPVLVSLVMNENPDTITVKVKAAAATVGNATIADWSSSSAAYTYQTVEMPSNTGFRNAFIFATAIMGLCLGLTLLLKNNGTLWQQFLQRKKDKVNAAQSPPVPTSPPSETKADKASCEMAVITSDTTPASIPPSAPSNEAATL